VVLAILENQFDCSLQGTLTLATTNMSIDDEGEVHYRIGLVFADVTNARVKAER
jgi:hypothetical protein